MTPLNLQGVLAVTNGPRGTVPHLVLQTPSMQPPYMQVRPPGTTGQPGQQQGAPAENYNNPYMPVVYQPPVAASGPAAAPKASQVLLPRSLYVPISQLLTVAKGLSDMAHLKQKEVGRALSAWEGSLLFRLL